MNKMQFPFQCVPATYLSRPNRFLVHAKLLATDQEIVAHCPDPGRLEELLLPDVRIYVSVAAHQQRKTQYDLRFVEHPTSGQLVSLDTRIPNQFIGHLLRLQQLEPFQEFTAVRPEKTIPSTTPSGTVSRIDFYLANPLGASCWLEVKSVTLVEDRIARFPDAPTTRGRRHVEKLGDMANAGMRCAALFLVQRPDADRLEPNHITDPLFSKALINAEAKGLEIYAYTCDVALEQISLSRRIPICLLP